MASSAGVLCGAGFETPAEALFLQKPLFVVPMRGQFEQQCNAEALAQMGVPFAPEFGGEALTALGQWLRNPRVVDVDYPDESREVLQQAFRMAAVEW